MTSNATTDNDLGPVFRLVPGVQSYDWGILGHDGSSVAKFAFEGTGAEWMQQEYKDDKPYAEVRGAGCFRLPSS